MVSIRQQPQSRWDSDAPTGAATKPAGEFRHGSDAPALSCTSHRPSGLLRLEALESPDDGLGHLGRGRLREVEPDRRSLGQHQVVGAQGP